MCVCCAGMQHSMLMTQETHPDMLNMIRLAHAMGTSAKEKKEHDKAMFTFGVASTALALEARNASLMTLDFVRKVDQKLDDLRTDFENGCFGSSASPEPKEPSASFDVPPCLTACAALIFFAFTDCDASAFAARVRATSARVSCFTF